MEAASAVRLQALIKGSNRPLGGYKDLQQSRLRRYPHPPVQGVRPDRVHDGSDPCRTGDFAGEVISGLSSKR